MPDYQVKISGNSDHHALQNLSSNTDANFTRTDNNLRLKMVTDGQSANNCFFLKGKALNKQATNKRSVN